MKLRDVLTREFFSEHTESRANKLLDREVVKVMDGCVSHFPSPHRNVYLWWILEEGWAVGWNENPPRGWSFPVAKLPSHRK